MLDIINNGVFAVVCALSGIGILHIATLCGWIGAIAPAGY